MLLRARPEPFDSEDHLFELKWDGMRALCFRDAAGYRLYSRNRRDITTIYPELAPALTKLPKGTALDGELIVMRGGGPDFHALMHRDVCRRTAQVALLATTMPATFIAFDLLYHRHKRVMALPLSERRRRLGEITTKLQNDRLQISSGIVGDGKRYFREVKRMGLEGIVAKRLNSPYVPGKRPGAWLKIKQYHTFACCILRYAQDRDGTLDSLLVGEPSSDGTMRHIGSIELGLSHRTRIELMQALSKLTIGKTGRTISVEPKLWCQVRGMQRTPAGMLRTPVFVGLRGPLGLNLAEAHP